MNNHGGRKIFEQCGDSVRVCNIALDTANQQAVRREAIHQLRSSKLLAEVREANFHPRARKALGDRGANATASTGDERLAGDKQRNQATASFAS